MVTPTPDSRDVANPNEQAAPERREFDHFSIVPFKAICGADRINQTTSQSPERVKCVICWQYWKEWEASRRFDLAAPSGRDWQPMETAPRNATWVEVETVKGEIKRAHYAQDYSGEHQPSFDGWFTEGKPRKSGDPKWAGGFVEIDKPVRWRPLPSGRDVEGALAELREMFPHHAEISIDVRSMKALQPTRYQIAVNGANIAPHSPSLAEAMQKVREWKAKHK